MDAETKQVLEDRNWWREFGKQFGWRLYGFTYRAVASFVLDDHIFEITRIVRDSIAPQVK